MTDWRNGDMTEWRNGNMTDWRNGDMTEWGLELQQLKHCYKVSTTRNKSWHLVRHYTNQAACVIETMARLDKEFVVLLYGEYTRSVHRPEVKENTTSVS